MDKTSEKNNNGLLICISVILFLIVIILGTIVLKLYRRNMNTDNKNSNVEIKDIIGENGNEVIKSGYVYDLLDDNIKNQINIKNDFKNVKTNIGNYTIEFNCDKYVVDGDINEYPNLNNYCDKSTLKINNAVVYTNSIGPDGDDNFYGYILMTDKYFIINSTEKEIGMGNTTIYNSNAEIIAKIYNTPIYKFNDKEIQIKFRDNKLYFVKAMYGEQSNNFVEYYDLNKNQIYFLTQFEEYLCQYKSNDEY